MKILIATDTYPPSVNGAAYFTYRHAHTLAERGHKVFVIAPSPTMKYLNQTDETGVVLHGVRSIRFPFIKKFWLSPLILSGKQIKKIIDQTKPDIIHIQAHFMIGRGVAETARQQNIPIVGTNHFMPENLVHYFHLPFFLDQQLKRFGWHQFRSVYRNLAAITAPTETAANLTNHPAIPKVIPVSCGVDLKRFNPDNNGEYLRQKFNLPNAKIMLYVGRLDKEKRLDLVLKSLPRILQSVDVHFVLAGIGNWEGYLRKLVRLLNLKHQVTFAGFVPEKDLPNLYQIADLFVIAGIAELQSIVTMEAMASGLPVLGVNAVALPELVHDGENGYLFEDGDTIGLADRAVKILTNPDLRQSMAKKSLEIIQKHDTREVIKNYELIYDRVLSHKLRAKSF